MVAGWPHLSYTVDKRILSLGQRLIILSQPKDFFFKNMPEKKNLKNEC